MMWARQQDVQKLTCAQYKQNFIIIIIIDDDNNNAISSVSVSIIIIIIRTSVTA